MLLCVVVIIGKQQRYMQQNRSYLGFNAEEANFWTFIKPFYNFIILLCNTGSKFNNSLMKIKIEACR